MGLAKMLPKKKREKREQLVLQRDGSDPSQVVWQSFRTLYEVDTSADHLKVG